MFIYRAARGLPSERDVARLPPVLLLPVGDHRTAAQSSFVLLVCWISYSRVPGAWILPSIKRS